MAGSLIGENNKTQLQRPCDDPYQYSVGVGTEQEGIYPGSSKAALAERGKEKLWLKGIRNCLRMVGSAMVLRSADLLHSPS